MDICSRPKSSPPIFDLVRDKSCDRQKLQAELDEGADPNADQKYAGTLLQQAIFNDNYDAVRLLLEAGADPGKVGWCTLENKPLIMAVCKMDYDCALMLLRHGAVIDGEESLFTWLYYTQEPVDIEKKRDQVLIKMLLSWGANLAIKSGEKRNLSIVELIRQGDRNRKKLADYIEITQQRLIEIMTKILSRGTVAGIRLPLDMVRLIVSYCYPHA